MSTPKTAQQLIQEWREQETGLPSEAHWADSKRACADELEQWAKETESELSKQNHCFSIVLVTKAWVRERILGLPAEKGK